MIRLDYGTHQTYRRRAADVTIRGRVEAAFPVGRSVFSLNDGASRPLYVEQEPDPGVDWLNGYKRTPAELRCRDQGEFCVEIDVADEALRARNHLRIAVEDAAGARHEETLTFDWDPTAPELPLDLSDLARFSHVQEIGQAVNGVFDLDRDLGVIRSRAPVAPDALFLVGGEATGPGGDLRECASASFDTAKWLGCGDFFAGMTEGVPERGLKVGWSSAGMAALSPRRWRAGLPQPGAIIPAIRANGPSRPTLRAPVSIERDFGCTGYASRSRWRGDAIACAGASGRTATPEPEAWLCEEDSAARLPG